MYSGAVDQVGGSAVRFRFTQVTLEAAIDGLRAVSSGLSEDDVIVVDGAFRLNSERRHRAGI